MTASTMSDMLWLELLALAGDEGTRNMTGEYWKPSGFVYFYKLGAESETRWRKKEFCFCSGSVQTCSEVWQESLWGRGERVKRKIEM